LGSSLCAQGKCLFLWFCTLALGNYLKLTGTAHSTNPRHECGLKCKTQPTAVRFLHRLAQFRV
jgi:hypothetical protein